MEQFPILEFDPDPSAMIRPEMSYQRQQVPEGCIMSFFAEANEAFLARHPHRAIVKMPSESFCPTVYLVDTPGGEIGLIQAPVGAPMAGGYLDNLAAIGFSKFMVCGSAGVLNHDLAVGHLMIPETAVRDEGTSYHYAPPGREISMNPAVVAILARVLEEKNLPYRKVKTWTTDAFYRETRAKVARRRAEGCACVEMESSALFAVADYLNVKLGQLLYSGDTLAGEEWDSRGFQSRTEVRALLLETAIDCLFAL